MKRKAGGIEGKVEEGAIKSMERKREGCTKGQNVRQSSEGMDRGGAHGGQYKCTQDFGEET